MRKCIVLVLLLAAAVSGQYLEQRLELPDSLQRIHYPNLMHYHSGDNTMYLAAYRPSLAVFDCATASWSDSVAVSNLPWAMCSRTGWNRLYVLLPLTGCDTVLVVDTDTREVIASLPAGSGANDICYNPNVDRAYCALANEDVLLVLDCAGDSILRRVAVGNYPEGVCCYSAGNKVYTVARSSDSLVAVACGPDTVVAWVYMGGGIFHLAVNEQSGKLYVASERQRAVIVLDADRDSIVAVVPMPSKPTGLAVNPHENKVYATVGDSGMIVAVCGSGDTLLASIRVGMQWSLGMAYVASENQLYCGLSSGAVVIDCTADTIVARLPWGEAVRQVAWCPVENQVYLAGYASNDLWILDCPTMDTVACHLLWFTPSALCASPDQAKVYCSSSYERRVAVIDSYRKRVEKLILVPGVPQTLYFSLMANRVYCGMDGDEGPLLAVIDASADTLEAVMSFPFLPTRFCDNPADRKVYMVAGTEVDTLAVVSADGDSVLSMLCVLPRLKDVGYNPVDNKVYCASGSANKVAVFDGASDSLLALVDVGGDPRALCYTPPLNMMCVSCWNSDCVMAIAGSSDTVYREVPVGSNPSCLAYNPVSGKLYCAETGSDMISAIDCSRMLVTRREMACEAPEYLEVDSAGNKLYCSGRATGGLTAYDCRDDRLIREFELDDRVRGMTWSPAGRRLLVRHLDATYLSVIQDTFLSYVDDPGAPALTGPDAAWRVPTLVRHTLSLDGRRPVLLFDATGRKTMALQPGVNDIRRVAPGVYFVREEGSRIEPSDGTCEDAEQGSQGSSVRKIVIQR